MKHRTTSVTALIVATAVVAAPGIILAYTTLGQSLGVSAGGNGYQRDLRVWNNALDPSANPAGATDPAFPDASGAALAAWKGAKAWASDTSTAARNFDFDWQGSATASNPDDNTISFGNTGCSGGTLAYTETPVDNGWRILVCESSWVWYGGTGTPSGTQIDLRGVLTHELGHALGLGHSQTVNCPTAGCTTSPSMCAFVCGNGSSQRVIRADDQAGLQAVYGAVPLTKPVITGLGGSFATGGTLLISGAHFAGTVNVKFTARTSTNTGTIPGVVANVPTSAGGTSVAVTIPAAAVSGNVLVWEPGSALLSNAFPITLNQIPPSVTSVTPSSVAAFGGGVVTLAGANFAGATSVNFGGTVLNAPLGFSIVNPTTITFSAPTAQALGGNSVTVTGPTGTSAPASFTYVEVNPPLLTATATLLSNGPFSAHFAGGANDTYVLVIAFDGTTMSYLGFNVLQNFIPLVSGPLSAVGVGSLNLTVPPGFAGTVFHTQVATISDTTGQFVGASNITVSTILL